MGLDTTHDAFHGGYLTFNKFRMWVAKAMGGSFPPHGDKDLDPMRWYWGNGYGDESHPGLRVFLNHSDCDGEFTPEECTAVADELEALLPKIEDIRYRDIAKRFISGCRTAALAGEVLVFQK